MPAGCLRAAVSIRSRTFWAMCDGSVALSLFKRSSMSWRSASSTSSITSVEPAQVRGDGGHRSAGLPSLLHQQLVEVLEPPGEKRVEVVCLEGAVGLGWQCVAREDSVETVPEN